MDVLVCPTRLPHPWDSPGKNARVQGRGSLVGCRLWGRTEPDTTEAAQQHAVSFISLHAITNSSDSHTSTCLLQQEKLYG